MENVEGGLDPGEKCQLGVAIGCAFVGFAFSLALGPIGALAGVACSSGSILGDYCDY
jgi:hypothetical protein